MASYYFLLKEADVLKQVVLKNYKSSPTPQMFQNISRYSGMNIQEKRISLLCSQFIQLNHLLLLFSLRYGSFVGSICTPAVCVVPSIKIIEGTHGLQCGKGVSPTE